MKACYNSVMSTYVKKYNPNRNADWNYGGSKWKLSRSKIDLFIECPRCFYLDNKLGTKRPSFPSFNLNIAVDELFKKEFDGYRVAGEAHPLMLEYKLEMVPFQHKELDAWRDNFTGVIHKDETTGLTVSGAVDDVWQKPDGTLVVADYKSTSKDGRITELGDSPWDVQYTRQLGVYRWLLEQQGFAVDTTAFLVYANASKAEDDFSDRLTFETTLIPVKTDTSWIADTLAAIKATLDSDAIPSVGEMCEFCPYREACGKKLMKMYHEQKK